MSHLTEIVELVNALGPAFTGAGALVASVAVIVSPRIGRKKRRSEFRADVQEAIREALKPLEARVSKLEGRRPSREHAAVR